ncbi:hypothetical protein ACVBEQ_10330 [Nakamurella sp. GG22]
MADKGSSGWAEDEVVAKLVADPGAVPDLQTLVGLLGRSDRPGYWRLYLSPQLDEYVECRTDDVVHLEKLGAGPGALGGTMVWLDRKATVQHTRPTAPTMQGEFLQGDIATDFLSSARMTGGLESELALWTIVIRVSARICTKICPDTGPTTCVTCLFCAENKR